MTLSYSSVRAARRLFAAALIIVLQSLGLQSIGLSAASAQNMDGAGLEPDLAAGKRYFYTCTGCHGIPGYNNVYPTYKVPMIGGQNELYIINALKAYRNGSRQHETMQIQAQSMDEQDIVNVAAYLASMGSKE